MQYCQIQLTKSGIMRQIIPGDLLCFSSHFNRQSPTFVSFSCIVCDNMLNPVKEKGKKKINRWLQGMRLWYFQSDQHTKYSKYFFFSHLLHTVFFFILDLNNYNNKKLKKTKKTKKTKKDCCWILQIIHVKQNSFKLLMDVTLKASISPVPA